MNPKPQQVDEKKAAALSSEEEEDAANAAVQLAAVPPLPLSLCRVQGLRSRVEGWSRGVG